MKKQLRHRSFEALSLAIFCFVAVPLVAQEQTQPLPAERKALDELMGQAIQEPPKWETKRVAARGKSIPVFTYQKGSIYLHAEVNPDGHVIGISNNSAPITNEGLIRLANELPELEWIDMGHWGAWPYKDKWSDKDFSGTGAAAFEGKKLTQAKFGGTMFNDEGCAALLKVPQLKKLTLNHAQVSDAGLETLSTHPGIEEFEINSMFHKEYTDATVPILMKLPALKKVSIGSTYLSWDGLKEFITRKDDLKEVSLKWCAIRPEDIERLKSEMPDTTIQFIPVNKAPSAEKFALSRMKSWVPEEVLRLFFPDA